MDPFRPGLNLRADLLVDGVTDAELRALRRRGALTTVRPGAYATAGGDDDPAAWHALAVRAAVDKVAPGAVVSHASAAVLHGLALWDCPLDRVHVTRSRSSGGRRTRLLHVHAALLCPDEVVEVGGIPVTSVARTVVDLARWLPFEPAVVSADAALSCRLVSPGELAEAVARAAGRTGNPDARRVVAFADGRAESVGETRSRVAIRRAGLPAPVLQYRVGPHRTDFGWPGSRTVGEFDGKVEYGRLLRAGQEPGAAVFAEKRREDELRDHGEQVVRWVWDELPVFGAVVAPRVRRAFERGER